MEQKFKPGTVYLFHSIFAINAAVEEELLIRNRFTKVVIKNKFEFTKETYNYLTIGELNIFLHTAKKYEDITSYTFLLVVVYTGMRKGEICSLQWQSIDFKNNIITIERTRDDLGTRTPKTKNSYRRILVDDLVIDHLKKYQVWCKQILLKHGNNLIISYLYLLINQITYCMVLPFIKSLEIRF